MQIYPLFPNPFHQSMELLLPYLNYSMTAALLIPLFIIACCHVLRKFILISNKTQPPKAAGAWPIIGHLPLLSSSKLLHITLGNLADKHGPIFTIQIGIHQAVIISSSEIAKELYTTHDIAVVERPSYAATKYLAYDGVMFGFAPYGHYWREIRKIISLKLLSNHQVELLKNITVFEVKTFLKELYEFWKKEEKKNETGNVVVALNQWFWNLSLNVILRMVVGNRYSTGGEAKQFQNTVMEFFHFMGTFVLRDAIPFLGWLDVGGHENAMKKTAKEMDSFFSELLEEHQKKGDSKEQDFMDAMLRVLQDKEFPGYDSDVVNKSACSNIVAGGSDTSTVTLTWAISLLLNNKQALKKAQQELDDLVGRKRQVNESDISKLVYVQAIIKETLRLFPPAPLLAPRIVRENCTVGGYYLKKGTWLITNIWKIQTDPRIWPDPEEFEPERFLASHKNIDVKGQNFELTPFGSGRRACPGIALGLQITQLALASFLHAFDIQNPTTSPIDMNGSNGLTNIRATLLEVVLSPRLPPELY